jgi:hypothetical protein
MVWRSCVSNEESCISNNDCRMNWGDFCYMYAFVNDLV